MYSIQKRIPYKQIYKRITIAMLILAAIMCALFAIAPKWAVKKSVLEGMSKSKLRVMRIVAALVAVIAIAMVFVILNNPYLFS